MSYQKSGPPPKPKDGSYGGGGYNSAPSKSQGYPYTPGFYTGPQGYPGAPRPGFPIAGAQSPNVQPQGVPPPPRPFWSVDAIPVPTTGKEKDKDNSYVGNVGDHPAVGNWGLPPIAQSYDHRPLHQHGGGTQGQASVDNSSSSHSGAGDSHAHGDKTSFPDSHSHDGDGKKSARQKSDGDRKAGKLSRLNLDVVLQDEQLKNLLFAGISKATAKLEQRLKTTDKKLENYASTDDSTSRHKAQQSVQTSSAEGPLKLKSILKRTTGEERVDVESKVSTESQASSDSFSNLKALEKTLHLLCGKANVEDVVRGSEKGSEKPVGALRQLESYNDSEDDYDHAEKDTQKQTKTMKNAPSTQPFWSKMDQLSQQTGQSHNLASSSQTKKAGDNEEELDSTVQNILQSIGFNVDSSKRPQEVARQKEQQDVLHTGMINQSASFLGQSDGLVKGVRAALFTDKQKKAQPDSLIKETEASLQKRHDYERSASGDTFSAETQSSKNSYSRKEKNPEPDNDRSRMGLGSREFRSDRHLENLQNKDWEQISPDEDEIDEIESRQIEKMKTLPHEKHAEVRQRSFSNERDAALSPHHAVLLDEARKSKDFPHGSHEKSLRPSERFRDEPKDEYIYQDVNKSLKAAALLAALCSKQNEVSSSGSNSLKLPLQSGSAQVENLPVTSRTVHSDDNKNYEPYIESRKMSLPSKSDVRIVSQSPVFRKSQSPEMKVPRKRPASPLPCPVSKEKEDRVLNEKRSFSVLQAFLKTSFEKDAPGFCQALGLNVDSHDKLPLLQTLLGGLNVGGLPAAESTRSPVTSDHLDRDSVRKSLDRPKLISPDIRTSRSPGMSRSPERRKAGFPDVPMSRAPGRPKSRSPDKRKSTSLDRRLSRSPDRRSSRLPDKMKSKSPNRQMSRSPVRRKSSLSGRRVSKSPDRRKSLSPSRSRSRSPSRSRSRSQDRHRSRSPDRSRSRSPDRHRSRSQDRHRSRSSDRRGSRSPYRRRSRSPGKRGSRARSVERSKSRSPHRLRSPARYKSKSPGRHRSQSTSRRRSSSPGQRRIRSHSVLPSQAIPPVNHQMLPPGQQNFAPQVQTPQAIPSLNQQMWPAGQQCLPPQVQTFNAPPPITQQMLPAGQQNLVPQVQTFNAPPPFNQQMLPTGQQCLPPQVQTFNAPPPFNQQMLPTGQQCLPPQVQTFNAPPLINQQMLPAGQQCLPPQVQSFNAPPPINQQMLPPGQQNLVPQVQTSHAISPFNQQMWPAGQQNFAPRTAAPNWPAAQNWQLPQYQRQNAYSDTNTTIINTYNMGILPTKENIPTIYEEDWEELPAAQSRKLLEEQKKELPKEQPKEQVQELPNVQEKEPEKEQKQQNQDSSKSTMKNDTKSEVDIFGEFPVYERKIIFTKMAQMNTAERQKLAQDLSKTQTRLAELKAEMAKLVKEQNEIVQRTGVEDANLPELTQNKKAQANLTEEVRRLLKASNYIPDNVFGRSKFTSRDVADTITVREKTLGMNEEEDIPEKTQVSGERQFKIPKLKNPQIKKQNPQWKGKLAGSTKPWLSKRPDTQVSGTSGSQAHQDLEDYDYYDSGNHWCTHCSLSFFSAPQMLYHIGTNAHRKKFGGNKQPWKSGELKQMTPKVGWPKRKLGRRQMKGSDMMCSVLGLYCKVCREFCGHIPDALKHLRTDSHYDKYMKFVKDSEREEALRQLEEDKNGSDDQTPSDLQISSRDAVKKEHLEQDNAQFDQKYFPDLVETECDSLDIPMPEEFPQLDISMLEEGGLDTKPILMFNVKAPLQVGYEKKRKSIDDEKRHGIQVEKSAALITRPSVAQIPDHSRKIASSGQADDRKKIKSSSSRAGDSHKERSKTDSAAEHKKNRKKNAAFIIEDSSEDEKDVLLDDTPTPAKRAKLSTSVAAASQDKAKVTSKTVKSSTSKAVKDSDSSATKSTSSATKSSTSSAVKSSTSAAKKVFTSATTKVSTPTGDTHMKTKVSAPTTAGTHMKTKVSTSTADSHMKTKVSTPTADSHMTTKVSTTPASTHGKEKVNTPTTTKVTSLTTPVNAKVSTSSASKVSSSSASKVSTLSASKVSSSSASKVSTSSDKKSKVSTPTAANVSTSASSSKKKAEAFTATSSSKIKTEAPTASKKYKVADKLDSLSEDSLSEDSCDAVNQKDIYPVISVTDIKVEQCSSDNESSHADVKQNKEDTKTSVKSTVSKSRKKQKPTKDRDVASDSIEEDSLSDLSSDSDDEPKITAVASRGHDQGKKSKSGWGKKPAAMSDVKVVIEMLKLSQPTVKSGERANSKKLSSSSSPSEIGLSGANPVAKKPKKESSKKAKVHRHATIDLTRLPVVKLRRLTDREIAFYMRPASKAAKKSSLYRPRPPVREESLDSDATVADETEDCPARLQLAASGDEECEAKGSVPNNVLQSSEGKDIPLTGVAGDSKDADSCEAKGSVPNNVLQSSEGKDIPLTGVAGDSKDADSCEAKGSVPNNVLQSSEGKDIPLTGVAGDSKDADSCEAKGSVPNNVLQSSEGKNIPLSGVAGNGEDADSCEAKVSVQNNVLQSSEWKDILFAAVAGVGEDEDFCEAKGSVPNDVLQSSERKDIPLSDVAGDNEDADSCEAKGSIPNDVLQSSEGKDIPLSGVAGDGEDADSKLAAVSEQGHTEGGSSA